MTIVAAWINAETGVGPAIASPSQACNGNCADLPTAASKIAAPMAFSAVELAEPLSIPFATPSKVTEPNCTNAIITARERPTSPTRFATNAFFAAVA